MKNPKYGAADAEAYKSKFRFFRERLPHTFTGFEYDFEHAWAPLTRERRREVIEDCWATPLDPRMPPDRAASGPHTNSRAIYYAVRPWAWKDKFPPVNRIGKDQRDAMVKKYADTLPFPKR